MDVKRITSALILLPILILIFWIGNKYIGFKYENNIICD